MRATAASASPLRRSRAPNLVAITGWHCCDHVAPVFEDDTLNSESELEHLEPLPVGGALAHLRSCVRAVRAGEAVEVSDWHFVGVVA
jgi:acyl dehydratase